MDRIQYRDLPRDAVLLLRAAGSPLVPNWAGRMINRPAPERRVVPKE